MEIEDQEKDILLQPEAINTFISVKSVNGKTGTVVLTTSDLENTSDYQTGSEVQSAIDIAISDKQDKLIAGDGISIEDNVISNTRESATWGNITGEISNQTDLVNEFNDLQSQIDAITVSSDVVDIVGSYAELQQYDTSHLTNNSIIKVLQDETHNNAMSYYKWEIIGSVGAWVYVGSEGPFYTKSETDDNFYNKTQTNTLLNNKMNKENPTGSGKLQINGLALGDNSSAIGTDVTTFGNSSLAEGYSENEALNIASDQAIISAVDENNPNSSELLEDWKNDKFSLAGGVGSHVEGSNSLALGKNSHAEGNGTIAENSSAHAEGTGSHANGKYSHAGGLETYAGNQGAFAHGQRVRAIGHNSIAMGYNESNFNSNNATGVRSVAIGYETQATADDSYALGKRLIASAISQFVVGKYNEEDLSSLFVVGNGQGTASRNNAFYISADGKAYIDGEITSNDEEKVLIDLKYLRIHLNNYFPIGTYLNNATAVDNAKDAGLYNVKFKYNLGGGDSCYGEMLVIPYVSQSGGNRVDYGAQLFFPNGDETNKNCFWYRTINRNTWNAWVKVDPKAIANSISSINTTLSDKQNITDNSLNTTSKTVPGAINEVNSIALGANQAISYANYQTMITAFNSAPATSFNVGQNIYVLTLDVPDLWVSSIEETASTYTYTTDAAFMSALETNGYVQVGYYKLSALETQEVDLTNYVTNTDYATSNIAGVVKSGSGFLVNSSGVPSASNWDYATYISNANSVFIGKGTLEAVITGKGLVSNTNYATQSTGGVAKMWTSTNEDDEIGLNISTE